MVTGLGGWGRKEGKEKVRLGQEVRLDGEVGETMEKVYGISHLVGCMKHLPYVIDIINIFMVQIFLFLHQSNRLEKITY